MSSYIRVLAMGIVLTLMMGGRVAAAPQILGLVATTEPTPLTCVGGICTAEFSTFCLQRQRIMPVAGTAYRPADGTELTLTVAGPDGTKWSFSASRHAIIESRRDYNAVRIAIPESVIRGLGGHDAAITVGRLASLVPIAEPGDRTPLDQSEIAYFTGPYREAVARTLEADSESADAARIVNRLINALPPGRSTAKRRNTLWQTAIGDRPPRRTRAGFRTAAREYRFCKRWADTGLGDGMRRCLEQFHDSAMAGFTKKVWELFRTGS